MLIMLIIQFGSRAGRPPWRPIDEFRLMLPSRELFDLVLLPGEDPPEQRRDLIRLLIENSAAEAGVMERPEVVFDDEPVPSDALTVEVGRLGSDRNSSEVIFAVRSEQSYCMLYDADEIRRVYGAIQAPHRFTGLSAKDLESISQYAGSRGLSVGYAR